MQVQLLAVLQRAADRPAGQLLHGVALLGTGQELVGQQQPQGGMAPADQALHAHHLQVEAGDDGLVVQLHLAALNGQREFAAQLYLCHLGGLQVGAEEAHVVAAFGLHRVHRGVGTLDQRARIGAVLRRE